MYFNRFDICEAHYALEVDYNVNGVLWERPSNRRRNMSIDYQLHRMGYRPSILFNSYNSLSENGREIYDSLLVRWGLL